MSPNAMSFLAVILLLFPMGYFLFTSPTFLLVKMDVPQVTSVMRGLFNAYFLWVAIAGIFGIGAFLFAERPLFAIGVAAITVFAVLARRWFLRQIDQQISARDAGDPQAPRRLRRLHVGGMVCNLIELAAVVSFMPSIIVSQA